MVFFTCIGSRSTPENILKQIIEICSDFCNQGYVLRSGGAEGADSAAELGCDLVKGKKEIYLPWKNFNNNNSLLYHVNQESLELAAKIHPDWRACSYGAKKLHARNCFQILGEDLKTPSKFVVCWTKNGELIGGTRTALVVAIDNNIPIYNLAKCQKSDILKLLHG